MDAAQEMAQIQRLKRIRFRAWHRGFREMDLIMGNFADAHLQDLDETGLGAFEDLLSAPDQDVYDWIVGRASPPPGQDTPTLGLIRSFRFFARHVARPDADAQGPV
jgi:antitoxin CptB